MRLRRPAQDCPDRFDIRSVCGAGRVRRRAADAGRRRSVASCRGTSIARRRRRDGGGNRRAVDGGRCRRRQGRRRRHRRARRRRRRRGRLDWRGDAGRRRRRFGGWRHQRRTVDRRARRQSQGDGLVRSQEHRQLQRDFAAGGGQRGDAAGAADHRGGQVAARLGDRLDERGVDGDDTARDRQRRRRRLDARRRCGQGAGHVWLAPMPPWPAAA